MGGVDADEVADADEVDDGNGAAVADEGAAVDRGAGDPPGSDGGAGLLPTPPQPAINAAFSATRNDLRNAVVGRNEFF